MITSVRNVTLALVLVQGCNRSAEKAAAGTGPVVAGTRIATAPPTNNAGEWTLPARDYANSRYSTLSEITS